MSGLPMSGTEKSFRYERVEIFGNKIRLQQMEQDKKAKKDMNNSKLNTAGIEPAIS
jgi:hypothetical protein